MIMTAWPGGGPAGWPERLSQTATRVPAAAPEMPGTVAAVRTPDRSPPPGTRQRASTCPAPDRLSAGGPCWTRTATAGRRRATACWDWYVCVPTMAARATATPKTASSATRTAPSNLSIGRLSGLRPASIRASRDIRPVAARGTVSEGIAKLLGAHRGIAVGLIDVPPGSGAASAGGARRTYVASGARLAVHHKVPVTPEDR